MQLQDRLVEEELDIRDHKRELIHPLDMDLPNADSADWRETWSSIFERCSAEEAEDIIEEERRAMWNICYGKGRATIEDVREKAAHHFWYLTNLRIHARY